MHHASRFSSIHNMHQPCQNAANHFEWQHFLTNFAKEFTLTTDHFLFRHCVFFAASAFLCTSAALAANAGSLADAQTRYRQDMAVCNSGQSNQDANTCRQEARNALAEARRGGLNDAPNQYQRNAMRRCDAHQGSDRAACEARMRGEGTVEGGVKAGGILRESETIVPAE